jgi:hypothetical protein
MRKSAGAIPTFYPQKEKDTSQREIKELLEQDWGSSTSSLPHVIDHDVLERPTRKVSTLRELLGIYVEIVKYETALNAIYEMIDHFKQGRENPMKQRVVNQVLRRKRTNEEFKFSAQIGKYDVDNVVLDFGYDVNVLPNKAWEMMGKPTLV